jgi:hypothetical protein
MHATSSQQSFGPHCSLDLLTHCVSELNDISGASSSNPVNVLTHTISDVSHRLTTASEALDARYLHMDTDASKHLIVLRCAWCCLTLAASDCSKKQQTWCAAPGIGNLQGKGRVMQCCTAGSAPAAGVKAQVVDMRRLAMTDHGLKVLERRVLEHLCVPALHQTLRTA